LLIDAAQAGVLSVCDRLPKGGGEGYTVAVVTAAELAKTRPAIPEHLLILTETEDPVTFIAPAGGDWSVLPWL
jgi:hypothetical protein